MQRLYSLVGKARGRLGCAPSVRRRAQKVDPAVRVAVATEMGDADGTAELAALREELTQAQALYEASHAQEIFLGQRTRQYRIALDERARMLKTERRESSLEDPEAGQHELPRDWDRRMEAWGRDEDTLQTVIEQHKEIVANCETIRRRIEELTVRQETLLAIQRQSDAFCEAAQQERIADREHDALLLEGVDAAPDEVSQDCRIEEGELPSSTETSPSPSGEEYRGLIAKDMSDTASITPAEQQQNISIQVV